MKCSSSSQLLEEGFVSCFKPTKNLVFISFYFIFDLILFEDSAIPGMAAKMNAWD